MGTPYVPVSLRFFQAGGSDSPPPFVYVGEWDLYHAKSREKLGRVLSKVR